MIDEEGAPTEEITRAGKRLVIEGGIGPKGHQKATRWKVCKQCRSWPDAVESFEAGLDTHCDARGASGDVAQRQCARTVKPR
jgi:hypothetical protein